MSPQPSLGGNRGLPELQPMAGRHVPSLRSLDSVQSTQGTHSDFRRVVLQARSSPQILGIGMAAAPGHI